MKQKPTSIVLAGAAPDTGNHGVTALCLSALLGLAHRGVDQFTVLDNGGFPDQDMKHPSLAEGSVTRLRFQGGRRIYRETNMHNVRFRQMVGLPSPVLNTIRQADAVLDISGGDSFTDLYGPARFDQTVKPKLMALAEDIPLVLMPQTFGPFQFKKNRDLAARIIAQSALAIARDKQSFGYLKELLGDRFDPARHRLGVDLAFELPTITPPQSRNRFAGINVSGLLWNDAEAAAERFGLGVDYKEILVRVCTEILKTTSLDIHLVPHVRPGSFGENDLVACRALRQALPAVLRGRVSIEEHANTPTSLKGVIAQADWFVGARMHATIAALSTCTPVANMAYSKKAKGVFDRCGVGGQVFDMRTLSTDDMVQSLLRSFEDRVYLRGVLQTQIPFVKRAAALQLDAVCDVIATQAQHGEKAYA